MRQRGMQRVKDAMHCVKAGKQCTNMGEYSASKGATRRKIGDTMPLCVKSGIHCVKERYTDALKEDTKRQREYVKEEIHCVK